MYYVTMQPYCLRSVFHAKGIHLKEESEINLQLGKIRFVKSISLYVMNVDTIAESSNGTVSAEITATEKTFNGNPFLVEVIVLKNVDETVDSKDVRRQLESIRKKLLRFYTGQVQELLIERGCRVHITPTMPQN
jgi:hypothetical protein